MKYSQFFLGLFLGVIIVVVLQKLIYSPSGRSQATASRVDDKTENPPNIELFKYNDNMLLLYGGKYGFYSGDGNIASIESDIEFSEDGGYQAGAIVVPGGAVLVAIKDHYILGYYTGKIKIEKVNGTPEVRDKVFFCIYSDGREIEFMYPSKEEYFAGEDIE